MRWQETDSKRAKPQEADTESMKPEEADTERLRLPEAGTERKKLQEAATYFKKRSGFKRFFQALRVKWQQYGRGAGWIVLEEATEEERQALTGILGRQIPAGKLRVATKEFEAALAGTRFAPINLDDLLAAYFHQPLVTNTCRRQQEAAAKANFFAKLIRAAEGPVGRWLEEAGAQKKFGQALLLTAYKKDPEELKAVCLNLAQTAKLLFTGAEVQAGAKTGMQMDAETGAQAETKTIKRLRLPLLSARVSGNPHYFDYANLAGKLLVDFLSWHMGQMQVKAALARQAASVGVKAAKGDGPLSILDSADLCQVPGNAEERLALYYQCGLQPDDISSCVVLTGITLYNGSGRPHPAYEAFNRLKEPYMVNMLNLAAITAADCASKKVYIVENQTVFAALSADFKKTGTALICTAGQVRTAALIVLDYLAASGCRFYYSGDLDPEGILIAAKLKQRYPEQLNFWHMAAEDYQKSLSSKAISNPRLRQLDVLGEEWCQVVLLLKQNRRAGYQEQLLEELEQDLNREEQA